MRPVHGAVGRRTAQYFQCGCRGRRSQAPLDRGVLVVANDDIHGARSYHQDQHHRRPYVHVARVRGLIGRQHCTASQPLVPYDPYRVHTSKSRLSRPQGRGGAASESTWSTSPPTSQPDLIDAAVAAGAKGNRDCRRRQRQHDRRAALESRCKRAIKQRRSRRSVDQGARAAAVGRNVEVNDDESRNYRLRES